MTGPVHQIGRARDLATASDGTTALAAEGEMRVVIDFAAGMLVHEITMEPAVDGLDAFVGARAGGGFRKVLDLETGAVRGSLPYLLLDDVPGATLVSGYAVSMAAGRGDADLGEYRAQVRKAPLLQQADICAGWQRGGLLLANLEQGGPPATLGPVAPSVVDGDDHDTWHDLPPLPPDGMRRARRIDVWRDGVVHVDVFFRDSMMGHDGNETAVHEYTVAATVDPQTMTFVVVPRRATRAALARVPAGHRQRGAARGPGRARPPPRAPHAQLVGPSTCTHLNDVLRGLEDVAWLTDELNRRR